MVGHRTSPDKLCGARPASGEPCQAKGWPVCYRPGRAQKPDANAAWAAYTEFSHPMNHMQTMHSLSVAFRSTSPHLRIMDNEVRTWLGDSNTTTRSV
jgi:hypothetical protein